MHSLVFVLETLFNHILHLEARQKYSTLRVQFSILKHGLSCFTYYIIVAHNF